MKECGECGKMIRDGRYKYCLDCDLGMFNQKLNRNTSIRETCSNCGKENRYSLREFTNRNVTLCKHCKHPLSVTPPLLGGMKIV